MDQPSEFAHLSAFASRLFDKKFLKNQGLTLVHCIDGAQHYTRIAMHVQEYLPS